jgi:hypothetical protein
MKELLIKEGFQTGKDFRNKLKYVYYPGYPEFKYGGIYERGIFKKQLYFYLYLREYSLDDISLLNQATTKYSRCFYSSKRPSFSDFTYYQINIPIECYKIAIPILKGYYKLREEEIKRERDNRDQKERKLNKLFLQQIRKEC